MKLAQISLLLVMFVFVSPNYAEAKKQAQGVFTVVKGKVTVQRAGKKKARKVKVGTKVYPEDTITADKKSRAKIVMTDKNILNISPESKVEIESYVNDPETKEKKVVLNLMYGKVRSTVKEKYDENKNVYRVKTPSAVAGVRGTDFFMGHNRKTKKSQVVTFEGRVQVGSGIGRNGALMNSVFVNPGQSTIASQSAPPAPPTIVPKGQLTSLDRGSNSDVAGNDSPSGENRNPASQGGEDGGEPNNGEPKDGANNQGGDGPDGGEGRGPDNVPPEFLPPPTELPGPDGPEQCDFCGAPPPPPPLPGYNPPANSNPDAVRGQIQKATINVRINN